MFRIRFHGRGGQGIKTASRILGTAFFLEGWEVQDAPRYGAERRGAPISAYVRASRQAIKERGIILEPDLVVISDPSVIPVPAAGVMAGLTDRTTLLIAGMATDDDWRDRLKFQGPIIGLPTAPVENPLDLPYIAAACAGAAASLTGVISTASLDAAIRTEIVDFGEDAVSRNLDAAQEAYEAMADHEGSVTETNDDIRREGAPVIWADLAVEDVGIAGPAIYAGATSVEVRTGLWRTMRPVIDYDRCNRCNWVCGTFCPDSAITADDKGYPVIDYDHCKGCMICVAQCPPHAIEAIPETGAPALQGDKP